MSEKVRTLLVDDHEMFLDGIKLLLKKESNIEICAEAHNGVEAYEIISTSPIDLLITDISMPEMDGIELTKKVKENFPHIKVLVLSMSKEREIISTILMAEADGYILKDSPSEELLRAVAKLINYGTYYSNEILVIMSESIKKDNQNDNVLTDLTTRELEILKLIMLEFSSDQIAEKLFISKNTVDTHRKNILTKTKIKTLVGLCKFAYRNNLVSYW